MWNKYTRAAKQYADEVIAGDIPAGKYTRLACQRFVDDLDRKDLDFKHEEAERPCIFIEELPHVQGAWARAKQKIKLEPVQCWIICNIFGFYDLEGDRRFNEAFVLMPRKNAKSTLAAGIGLYMLCADREPGAEVLAGATNEAQAFKVFGPAREMVRRTPQLQKHYGITVAVKSLHIADEYSVFRPIIGKPGDGDNVHCGIADELHEHESSHMIDALRLGMGARTNPLLLQISTAGVNVNGVCWDKDQEVRKLLDGVYDDDALFGVIFHIDEGDEWDSEASLAKANPLWGVSKNIKNTIKELTQARRSASSQSSFRQKHLNEWTSTSTAWMNILKWRRQRKEGIKLEDFAGCPAWVGIDLASKKDLAAIATLVPHEGNYYAFWDFFVPENMMTQNDNYERYREWLTITPGAATDYGFMETRLSEIAGIVDLQTSAFDPWQAQYMMQRLMACGMAVTEFPMQVRVFSDPMKQVEAWIEDRKLWHDNRCADWQVSNVQTRPNHKEELYPGKAKVGDQMCKIDGIVALIMATGVYLRSDQASGSLDEWLADPVVLA